MKIKNKIFLRLMAIDINSIPNKYTSTYVDKVEDFLLIYSPLSEEGVTVLNKEALWLFQQIDNKKSLGQILKLAQKKDSSVTFSTIKKILEQFINSEIIYFDSPKTEKDLLDKKPTQLGVWLHLTNQCNLRCTYCYVYKTPEKMSLKTAKIALTKIITSAKLHGFKKISIKFSGGECLLELDNLLKIVEFARNFAEKIKIKIEFAVLTNGILINDSVAKKLKEFNIQASVSLDGLGKFHNKQRIFPSGKGSFNFVERGIEMLRKHGIIFNVSITITENNVANLPELTQYLLDKNIPFVFNFFRENPHVSEKLESDDKKLVKYIKIAYGLIGDRPPRYSLINGLLDRVFFTKPHIHTCGMGQNYIVVRHDGRIASCQMTLAKPIGSIEDKDVINTMKAGNFIRPRGLNVFGKSPCKNCQWKYICCGSCPLLTFSQKGKYNLNSPYCAVYKALIPEALKVEARRLIKYGCKNFNSPTNDSLDLLN